MMMDEWMIHTVQRGPIVSRAGAASYGAFGFAIVSLVLGALVER
jgi:hypothetical protein